MLIKRYVVQAEVGMRQGNLFAQGPTGLDPEAQIQRLLLDEWSWLDTSQRWLCGADELLEVLASSLRWTTAKRTMYDKVVEEPRLGTHLRPGFAGVPGVINDMTAALDDLYRTRFNSVWINYYRGGNDSVAWHSDRIGVTPDNTIVAIVSLGGPRRFLLRPEGGGPSRPFTLTSGDLLVMGGACQQHWQHAVPKTSNAAPRMSVTFRCTSGASG